MYNPSRIFWVFRRRGFYHLAWKTSEAITNGSSLWRSSSCSLSSCRHPLKETNFSHLYPQFHSFGGYSKFMTMLVANWLVNGSLCHNIHCITAHFAPHQGNATLSSLVSNTLEMLWTFSVWATTPSKLGANLLLLSFPAGNRDLRVSSCLCHIQLQTSVHPESHNLMNWTIERAEK